MAKNKSPKPLSAAPRPIEQIGTKRPPDETAQLRQALNQFKNISLDLHFSDAPTAKSGKSISVGAVKWGVYAFFDYDGEPIYVGQTCESLGSRIGRHLTNQRTDAVAMSVLDPFEVLSIEVWPLHQYQSVSGNRQSKAYDVDAVHHLNQLERTVFDKLVGESSFGRILNEKDPPFMEPCSLPGSVRVDIVDNETRETRQHPDVRIARRAQTIARLTQIIAGRDVQNGLRRALYTQADRLAFLAKERFIALGGEASVEHRAEDQSEDDQNGDME